MPAAAVDDAGRSIETNRWGWVGLAPTSTSTAMDGPDVCGGTAFTSSWRVWPDRRGSQSDIHVKAQQQPLQSCKPPCDHACERRNAAWVSRASDGRRAPAVLSCCRLRPTGLVHDELVFGWTDGR
jgi:hypothetical protein